MKIWFWQERAIIALGLHLFRGSLQVAQSWLNKLYMPGSQICLINSSVIGTTVWQSKQSFSILSDWTYLSGKKIFYEPSNFANSIMWIAKDIWKPRITLQRQKHLDEVALDICLIFCQRLDNDIPLHSEKQLSRRKWKNPEDIPDFGKTQKSTHPMK